MNKKETSKKAVYIVTSIGLILTVFFLSFGNRMYVSELIFLFCWFIFFIAYKMLLEVKRTSSHKNVLGLFIFLGISITPLVLFSLWVMIVLVALLLGNI